MLLTPSLFFAPDSGADPELFGPDGLFAADQPVWSALARLRSHLDGRAYPALAGIGPESAGPLPRTLVLYGGEVIAGEECAIEFGDATKGKLVVRCRGEALAGATVLMAGTVLVGNRFAFGRGVLVESGALLKEPVVIGDQSEIRQGAYLRGYCLIGRRCVVGHVTEVKHTIFLDDAKAGHFAYLGDSILGRAVNLGAGTKLANLRFQGGEVRVRCGEQNLNTGLKKLGAILGDQSQTGCNAVTNPGALLGKRCIVPPNTTAPSGYHRDHTVIR